MAAIAHKKIGVVLTEIIMPVRDGLDAPANPMVINAGRITVRDAGLAALVAPHMRNSGVIEARVGTVELASARGFTLDLYGDRLISFKLDDQVAETRWFRMTARSTLSVIASETSPCLSRMTALTY